MIIETEYWIWILPSQRRELPKEWATRGGKWLIFDKRENLEKLAEKLEPYVESGLIHSAKYAPEENSVMCVYCLDYEKEKVWEILQKLGVQRRIWKYDYQTLQDWTIGGKLWLKNISSNDVLCKKLVEILKKAEKEIKKKEIIPIKASTLADYFWCAKRSYLTFLMENTPEICKISESIVEILPETCISHPLPEKIDALIKGIQIHGRSYGFFVEPMNPPQKEKVFELAKTGKVMPRNIDKYQIQGAVDEITKEEDGYVIKEIKTTSKEKINPYILFPARFQLQIYGWILSAYIPIKTLHLTVISQATNQTLHKETIQFNEKETENKIQKTLKTFEQKNLKTPKPWKCKYCETNNICQKFYQSP